MWKSMVTAMALVTGLAGCAALNTVESDVSTFSQWPAGRKPASYTFERLPSQKARPNDQARIELLARPALEAAGFKPAEDEKTADVTVQVGARTNRADRWLYDDPLWWPGGMYYSRWGRPAYFRSHSLMYQFDSPRYEREVAVLVRDRSTAQALYEARALNDGNTPGGDDLLGAMFQAAMMDFPHSGINPRRVSVRLQK